jgi:hypothetical protein
VARIEKTVFVSYRRADRWPALAVFKDLTQHGYDVFIDYDGIASGDFERAIVDNIRARAHFIVVLTPTALERCDDPTDWLRREIEVALEAKRNVVPLLLDGFRFDTPIAVQRLQGSLGALRRYQGLKVPEDFFDAAMERLRSKHLAVAVEAVLHPAPAHAQQVAQEQREAASKAAAIAQAQEKIVAPSAPTAQQRAQGQLAAIATDEGLAGSPGPIDRVGAAATVVPAYAKPYALLVGSLAIALCALVVLWLVLSSGGKNQAMAPSATVPPSGMTAGEGQGASPPSAAAPAPLKVPTEGPTDAVAQNALGDDYYFGRNGLKQDDVEAVKWYRKAAEQGNASGQARLGFMYANGRGGLAKDDAEAMKWYRKAAEQGSPEGQASLGIRYEYGRGGLAKDDAEAVKWYRKAAEQGSAAGQAYLADMYERGVGGLPKDRAQALKLYHEAASQGDDYALSALKRMGEK